MLKYILNNYNKFLKSTRNHFSIFLNKEDDSSSNEDKELDILSKLDREIALQERNLQEKKDIEKKHDIRDKLLYLYIKKRALEYNNGYIKIAEKILDEDVEDSAYEALNYLNRVPKNIAPNRLKEIHIVKGLIYEILEDFDEASKEYKKAIKYDKGVEALNEYKKYVLRSREVLNWHKASNASLKYSSFNLHNIVELDDIPEVAKRLDSLAKYYARSPKSRELGKRYYKEVIKLYKRLYQSNSKKYACDYVASLIEGVETFVMSPSLLREAYDILVNTIDCIDSRIYLLEKIKELKSRDFIKRSRYFDE